MGNERLKVMVKEKGPRILLAVGLIGAALLCPIVSISNVEAQSPDCTDEQKQTVNVVRGNGQYGTIDVGDLAAIGYEIPFDIGKLALAATCYGQEVEEGCLLEEGTEVRPRCDYGIEQCGVLDSQPLFYIPGNTTGIAVSFLTTALGGKIKAGGDLQTSSLGSSCRVKPLVGEPGWIEREDIFKVEK